MAVQIDFPANLNGIVEVGIAAGVDSFADAAYSLAIVLRASNNAPPVPTLAQVRAAALVTEWAAAAANNIQANYFADMTLLVGASGVAAADIIALIDNWPANQLAADAQVAITANVATQVVTAWNAWTAIPADVRPDTEVDLDRTFRGMALPGANEVAQRVWQGVVAFAAANGWLIRREVGANGMLRYVGPEAPWVQVRTHDEVNATGFLEPQMSATLIVALKVTWWQINHHVGQVDGRIDGYVGKVASAHGLTSASNTNMTRETRRALWAIGKVVSTRGILAGVGIPNIAYADASNTGIPDGNDYARAGNIAIGIADDMRVRISSSPAGTASIFTHMEILKRAMRSAFGVCIPNIASVTYDVATSTFGGPCQAAINAIAADPARYHMGSMFLTGQPRIIPFDWSDEDKANLAAFIHAVAAGSTLARASCILPPSEVTGNITFATITSIRTNLMDAVSDRMRMMLVNRIAGGAARGGLAVQAGLITAEQVQEVEADIALIDEGPVDADEPPVRGENANTRTAREARNAHRAARRAARARAGVHD